MGFTHVHCFYLNKKALKVLFLLTVRSSAVSFHSSGYNMHQTAQNTPKVPFVLWTTARRKVLQLSDPNRYTSSSLAGV